LEILNRGDEPAFCNSRRLKVIDITLGSLGISESIKAWEVSSEPSLSDHKHIMFKLKGSVPERLVRDPRGTEWDSFRWDLRGRLEQGPKMNMRDEAGLGLNISYLQQALISAYENNCSLRIARAGKLTLRWTSNLETLRREVRRLFNKSRRERTSQSWELHKEAQRRYRKVRKASKESWRAFCNSINDLPTSVRLQRALSRDTKTKLGSLVTPSGL
jgi:hypothetical protein